MNEPAYISSEITGMINKSSQEKYNMIIEKNEAIQMSDGTMLMADIYRPDCEEGVPSLVGWSPYGKDVQALGLERKPLRLGQVLFDQTIEVGCIDYFVKRGYAVVVPSPRGVSTSEGQFTGMLSLQDQKDCCQVIDWIGKQDFSSEMIGMIGTGYAGKIQPLVAALKPEYLKAIMPIEITDDLYKDCYWGGCITDHNFYYAGLVPAINPITEAELNNSEAELKAMLKKCTEIPEIKANTYFLRGLEMFPPRHYTWNIDVLLQPKNSQFWKDRNLEDKIDNIDIPMYISTPYYEYGRNVISAINIFNSSRIKSVKKLMLSQHATEKKSPETFTNLETLRWYDYWLKGIDTGILEEPPVKVFVMGENKFRYENEFPLKRAENTKLYFNSNSSLSFNPVDYDERYDELPHTPPTKLSQNFEDIPSVKYTSESLDEDMEVIGVVSVSFYASVDIDKANFIAKLWDVDENGKRLHLSSGFLKSTYRKRLKSAELEFMINDFDNELETLPNEIYEYAYNLAPTSNVFKKNHRVQIEIKTMDKRAVVDDEKTTLLLLHPSSRVDGIQPITDSYNCKIHYGKVYQSCVKLPVVASCKNDNWIK